jgi:hypothetical protein
MVIGNLLGWEKPGGKFLKIQNVFAVLPEICHYPSVFG